MFSWPLISGLAIKAMADELLKLLRDLIVSDILSDERLSRQMRSNDTEEKSALLGISTRIIKTPSEFLGIEIGKIKGLSSVFENLSQVPMLK